MRTAGQAVRFAGVGLGGVVAYLGVFVLLHGVGAQLASLLARLLVVGPTSVLAARLAFRSPVSVRRACAAGLAGLLLGAALSAAGLRLLHALDPHATTAVEVAVLVLTQGAAVCGRFALLRRACTVRTATGPSKVQPSSQTQRPRTVVATPSPAPAGATP